MRYTAILIFAIICLSCNKTDDIYSPIDITVKMNDDVSPLKAEFSIPGEWDFVEWSLEGNTSTTDYNINPISCVYSRTGPAKIRVIAHNNATGKKVTGSTKIIIPRVARKLKLSGISFRDAVSVERFNQKQLSVSLLYLVYGNATEKIFTLPARSVTQNDTIFFPETVIYDINGFEAGTMNNHSVFVKVKTIPDNFQIFGSSFSVPFAYFAMHAYLPDVIQLFNISSGNSGAIYIPCDWLPQ